MNSSNNGPALSQPEYSLVIVADDLPREGRHFKLVPDAETRKALAERFSLISLDRLEGIAKAKPLADGSVRVEAKFQAEYVQSCIVSLQPVPETLDEEFTAEFCVEEPTEAEVEHNLEEADPREPMENGTIDLGELLSQQLSLMMDPYPRAADSDLAEVQRGAGENGKAFDVNAGRENPFAVLAQLKDGKKK